MYTKNKVKKNACRSLSNNIKTNKIQIECKNQSHFMFSKQNTIIYSLKSFVLVVCFVFAFLVFLNKKLSLKIQCTYE